jgi:hypothetical protein
VSVVIDKEGDFHSSLGRKKCNCCGHAIYRFPFLEWSGHGPDNLILCSECCQAIKKGITADLIHITAIADVNDLGYHQYTLQRLYDNNKKT